MHKAIQSDIAEE